MFLDRVIHFGKNLGDQGKCYSPKNLISLIEVTKVAHLEVPVVSFNMNLIFLRSVFLDKFIHFGKNLGDQVMDRSTKKVKSLIEVPYVALLKVEYPSFNMKLFSSP